jgi:hypothetical protein
MISPPHQPHERGRHARLHLEKRFASGEAESARVLLDDRPFRAASRFLERQAGELADVDLEQAALHAHGQVAGAGDGERRLPSALQRRGVDGGDLGERADPGGGLVRLAAALVGEMRSRPGSFTPVVGVNPWRTRRISVGLSRTGRAYTAAIRARKLPSITVSGGGLPALRACAASLS